LLIRIMSVLRGAPQTSISQSGESGKRRLSDHFLTGTVSGIS
jgi:hypothetical protein